MKRVLHIISQAHLDPVWLWPTSDGMSEALCTLQSAVDRCREFPDFKFTRSSAIVYRWAKETDPRLYAKIQKLVEEGRWEIIGNWIEQPDCNLPATRSFQRQSELGCAFFQKEFGHVSRIGYNPDSFGHAAGLPRLLKDGGMDYYAFMRPTPEDNPDIPLLFHWESTDGARVLAQRIPSQYSQSYASTSDDVEARIRIACAGENFAPGFEHGVFWLGIGNHGGGPTCEHLRRVLELQRDTSLPEIRFSTLQEYFDCVEKSSAYQDLPFIRGELGYALRGSYSASTEVKRLNRAAEKALTTAETVTAMSGSAKDFTEASWDLCYNQFHDILAGTCIAEAWPETRNRFGNILDTCNKATLRAAFCIAREVDTSAESASVLFALNHLPWSRQAMVSLDGFIAPHGRKQISHLETQAGKKIPIQWTAADANFGPWGLPWGKLHAVLPLPASGYQSFRIVAEGPELDADKTASCTATQFLKNFEESFKPKELPPEPVMTSLGNDQPLLSEPIGLAVYADPGDTWGHGLNSYDQHLGSPQLEAVQCLSEGELFHYTRQYFRWKDSEIWLYIIRHNVTGEVDLRFRINWQQTRELLRLKLCHTLVDATVTASVPGAAITRPNDSDEYPMLDWLLISSVSAHEGLLLINDGCSSYASTDESVSVILCRSTPYAEHDPFLYKETLGVHFTDMGWQECQFRVVAVSAEISSSEADQNAEAFQCPAIALFDCPHPGSKPWTSSI